MPKKLSAIPHSGAVTMPNNVLATKIPGSILKEANLPTACQQPMDCYPSRNRKLSSQAPQTAVNLSNW